MAKVKLLILDVDGVLTDGKIYLSPDGQESKNFHVQDGYGLVCLQKAGVLVAVISGRQSQAVSLRMAELGITDVYQNVSNKSALLTQLLEKTAIPKEQCAYVGDDLPDFEVMQNVGHKIAVANAMPPILAIADWCTRRSGGEGAVREVCDWILASLHHG